jgi:2-phospho-L-lactate guanylyltransferase
MTVPTRDISLVLPVKDTASAKSRMDLPASARQRVAMALAHHALEIAAKCLPAGRICVVTSDDDVRKLARRLGARVISDPGLGLNHAIEFGVTEARRVQPRGGILVLVGDLPEVGATTLNAFLDSLDHSTATAQYVTDRSGLGTTAVYCPPGVDVRMVFGRDSAARFRALGCQRLGDAPRELRSDLDTADDLIALQSELHLSWLRSAAG